MDYNSDSDISDDTRDLVSQGLASVKRKRFSTAALAERIGLRDRAPVPNMDTSNVRSPLRREAVNDDTSTHGLYSTDKEIVNGQNCNKALFELVSYFKYDDPTVRLTIKSSA